MSGENKKKHPQGRCCNMDEAIPETESTIRIIFDSEELESIVKVRTDFEFLLSRPQINPNEFIKYINSEISTLETVRTRCVAKNISKSKSTALVVALFNKIDNIFGRAICAFPNKLTIWQSYLMFCETYKMIQRASLFLKEQLKIHGLQNPKLYKVASDWAMFKCKNFALGKMYLTLGIQQHMGNRFLLKELFHMELRQVEAKRNEFIKENRLLDPTNPDLTSKRAEWVYNSTLKDLGDVELYNELWQICGNYDFANVLRCQINELILQFPKNEKVWDIMAKRELLNNEVSKKARLSNCVAAYENAVGSLNTPRMWMHFLDTLVEQSEDQSELPDFKRTLLLSALTKATMASKLNEKHYLLWVHFEKGQKLVDMMKIAVKEIPFSIQLWLVLLRTQLAMKHEKQAYMTFNEAVEKLGSRSLPLWEMMLKQAQLRGNSKVNRLYLCALSQPPEISNIMKPRYLEWLQLTYGISSARKLYRDIREVIPYCLELHKKMISLEFINLTLNVREARLAHKYAVEQFGEVNADIWLDFCKFEITYGDPERVGEIYWTARQRLAPNLIDKFVIDASSLRTIPLENE